MYRMASSLSEPILAIIVPPGYTSSLPARNSLYWGFTEILRGFAAIADQAVTGANVQGGYPLVIPGHRHIQPLSKLCGFVPSHRRRQGRVNLGVNAQGL